MRLSGEGEVILAADTLRERAKFTLPLNPICGS